MSRRKYEKNNLRLHDVHGRRRRVLANESPFTGKKVEQEKFVVQNVGGDPSDDNPAVKSRRQRELRGKNLAYRSLLLHMVSTTGLGATVEPAVWNHLVAVVGPTEEETMTEAQGI